LAEKLELNKIIFAFDRPAVSSSFVLYDCFGKKKYFILYFRGGFRKKGKAALVVQVWRRHVFYSKKHLADRLLVELLTTN
jgi:hypothetical protein